MPFCPNCGKEVKEGELFCNNCGYQLTKKETVQETKEETSTRPTTETVDAISAFRKAVDIVSAKPTVLLPALIGAFISAILSSVATLFFTPFTLWNMNPTLAGIAVTGAILTLLGGIISYIMGFASLDMARNAYLNKNLNLGESVNYVIRRIVTFLVASIVGALMAITIILIPVVILMFVIMVVDEVGLTSALSQAFKVLGNKLGDIIILIIIGIVGSVILGFIPFLGSILVAAFNVVLSLAYIAVYFATKRQ